MRILLTNDDGVHAQGMRGLYEALKTVGDVEVVVPLRECSAGGHAVSMVTPLRVRKVAFGDGFKAHAVDGTPADCVKLALSEILKRTPDLVVSGINHGANIGMNVFYSGTVSAALEGAMAGLPAFAVSAQMRAGDEPDFAALGGRFAGMLPELLPAARSSRRVLSVNFPAVSVEKLKPVRWASLTLKATHQEQFEKRHDPEGQAYYWNAGIFRFPDDPTPTDAALLKRGHVTITPLIVDLTDHGFLRDRAPARTNGARHGKKA